MRLEHATPIEEKGGDKTRTSAADIRAPIRVGRYNIAGQLGKGSLGIVYEGVDQLSGERVAVKVLQKNSSMRDAEEERAHAFFLNEAQVTALMHHPNILRTMDAAVESDFCFIATELVRNPRTLREFIHPGKLLPVEQVAAIIYKCAMALDHVHQRQVIHLDIKPENIMLTQDGEPKIGDFGIACSPSSEGRKQPEDEEDRENKKEILGSPRYMAPERFLKGTPTPASDLFSLGVIAYEMLAGNHPFAAGNLRGQIVKIVKEPPVPLSAHRGDLPDGLQNVIERALSKKPSERYQEGVQMATALAGIFKPLQEIQFEVSGAELVESLRPLNFFADFMQEELEKIARLSLREDYQPGEEIIREGVVSDSFFILVSGNVSIIKGDHPLDELRPGACFGEMGYLTGCRRTATVLAANRVSVVKFNANLVDRLEQQIQLKLCKAFIRVLVQRLAQATGIITMTG